MIVSAKMDSVQEEAFLEKLHSKVRMIFLFVNVSKPFLCSGNCPKPRRVILRKKRRKLYTNEKERLQERRNSLLNKEYDAVVVANGYEGTYNENKKEDTIERNVEKKDQAYEEAIEKLKSLSKSILFNTVKIKNLLFLFQFERNRQVLTM